MELLSLEILDDSVRVHSKMSVSSARNVSFKTASCVGNDFTYLADNLGSRYVTTGCGGDYAGTPKLVDERTYTGYVEFQGKPVGNTVTFTYHSWFSSPIEFTISVSQGP